MNFNLKYEMLLDDTVEYGQTTCYRIRARHGFGRIRAGELGGYIASEENLSIIGDAWVYDQAIVTGRAKVLDNARVCGRAQISDRAVIRGDAIVGGEAKVSGYAYVGGNAQVADFAQVSDRARITGFGRVFGAAQVRDHAQVADAAVLYGRPELYGYARLCGKSAVTEQGDFMTVDNVGSQAGTLTCARGYDGKIYVAHGCFEGTLDEFEAEINRWYEADRLGVEYWLIIELARLRLPPRPDDMEEDGE